MLPTKCFCGCGEPRGRTDIVNLEGFNTAMCLMYWLKQETLLRIGEYEGALDAADDFMETGRGVYLSLLSESHAGMVQNREGRKQTKRWLKFSAKAQKKTQKVGLIEAMDFPPVDLGVIRDWATDDAFPPPYQEMIDEFERLQAAD